MSELTVATTPSQHQTATASSGPLPNVLSPLSSIEILSRLDNAARRGKLPGFHKGDGDVLFFLADFGTPFESALLAQGTPSGSGTSLIFSLRIKPLMPWIFIASMVLSVWPGIWLTDSMLKTYFSGYTMSIWWTCVWYLPLTVPFVPIGTMQALKRSRVSAQEAAIELIRKVQALVGEPEVAPPAASV
jgi:hypothetical protein